MPVLFPLSFSKKCLSIAVTANEDATIGTGAFISVKRGSLSQTGFVVRGRLPGQKPNYYKLTPYRYKIKRALKAGRSKLSIAKEFGVTWVTLDRFVRYHLNDKLPPPLTEPPKKHGHPTKRELEYFAKNP